MFPVLRIALAAAVFALCECGGEEAEDKGADSPADTAAKGRVGSRAPDFSVVAVTGSNKRISLKKLRGKVVVVDFWGTFCEPCKKSFPKLQALSKKYASRGFRVIGISEDEEDDKEKIPAFGEEYGAKFPL